MLLAMSCITAMYSRAERNRVQTFMQVKMCMRDKGHITQGSLCLWTMLGKREDRLFSGVVWMSAWRLGKAWGHFLRAFIISEFYVAPNSGRFEQHFYLVSQLIKNLPAMQETWVRSLGWDDPLEEGMATHSSILARRIPMETCLQGNNVDLSIGE